MGDFGTRQLKFVRVPLCFHPVFSPQPALLNRGAGIRDADPLQRLDVKHILHGKLSCGA